MKYLKFSNLKIKYSFLFFLTAITVLISCADKNPKHENQEPTKEMLAHIINTEDAVNMYQNYGKERIAILKDTLHAMYGDNFKDTRMVQINLKILKNYIAYVEKKSAEVETDPESLHFYFTVYPKDKGDGQENHQSFFIAPATKNGKSQSGYTLEKKDDKTQILYLKDVLGNNDYSQPQDQNMQKASFFSFAAIQGEDGLLFNDIGGSPPLNAN